MRSHECLEHFMWQLHKIDYYLYSPNYNQEQTAANALLTLNDQSSAVDTFACANCLFPGQCYLGTLIGQLISIARLDIYRLSLGTDPLSMDPWKPPEQRQQRSRLNESPLNTCHQLIMRKTKLKQGNVSVFRRRGFRGSESS